MKDTVLLTTDFSEVAAHAVPHAARLARALGAPVRVLHVVDTIGYLGPDPRRAGDWQARVTGTVEERLADLAERLRAEGLEVVVRHRMGSPPVEIVREAAEGVCAIVMATHGYGGFRRLVLGSAATKVMRTAPVPVLIVGPDSVDRDVRTILAPVELDSAAAAALAAELDLAHAYGARVELFNAVIPDVTPMVLAGAEPTFMPLTNTAEVIQRQATFEIGQLARRAAESGLEVTTRVDVASRAGDAILARAAEIGADLIVMRAHGHRGLSRLVLGSVTEEVVRHATLPVLVVKAPAPRAET